MLKLGDLLVKGCLMVSHGCIGNVKLVYLDFEVNSCPDFVLMAPLLLLNQSLSPHAAILSCFFFPLEGIVVPLFLLQRLYGAPCLLKIGLLLVCVLLYNSLDDLVFLFDQFARNLFEIGSTAVL